VNGNQALRLIIFCVVAIIVAWCLVMFISRNKDKPLEERYNYIDGTLTKIEWHPRLYNRYLLHFDDGRAIQLDLGSKRPVFHIGSPSRIYYNKCKDIVETMKIVEVEPLQIHLSPLEQENEL